MRTLTAQLIAVQAMRSPQARATVTVEQRGLTPGATPWIWQELVSNSAQSSNWRVTAAVCLSDGTTILRFKESGSKVYVQEIADPTDADEWTGNAWTELLAHGSDGLATLNVEDTIRLFYTNSSNGNVYYIETTDDGDNWGSPVTIYSGGDAYGDLVVAYIAAGGSTTQNGWILGFTTYSGGTYDAVFSYYEGAAWVNTAYGTTGWRASGIDSHSIGKTQTYLSCFMHKAQDLGPSRLRHIQLESASYANPVDIDQTQAGLFGLGVGAWRFFDLNLSENLMLGTTVEMGDGSGTYVGIAGLMFSEEMLTDEPIMFPSITSANDRAYTCLVESDGNLYHCGDTYVAEAREQDATNTTLTPIQYVYDNHNIIFEFAPSIDTLYAGQILKLTRTLSMGAQSGNESIRFLIIRIEQGLDAVHVRALDAVGLLGLARCRRPSIINDGNATGLAQVLRRLAARYGVAATSDDSALETAGVMPLTLQPSESLLGAAYRITSQSPAYLVPANDGTFAITIITPGDSDVSGEYVDTPYTYPMGQESVIVQAASISDSRRLGFSYILGTNSTDPEDGSAVGMAEGPRLDNTHPISVSLTNTRYNTQARVEAAAMAEASRQATLPVTAIIESSANLALEKYDLVSVTIADLGWSSQQFRIRNIIEKWDHNRLTQTLHLGDV